MRRRAIPLIAAAVALVAAALSAPAATADDAPAPVAPAVSDGGPDDRHRPRLYTPAANPDAYTQAFDLVRAGQYRDAAGILAMARTPQAVWFGDQSPAEVEREARQVVRDAEGDTVVFSLYNVPGRDCSGYSGGGANTTAEYKAWVDAVARGIGRSEAIVILETDSLALIPSDCGQDDAQGTKTAARYAEVNYAIDQLEPLRGTRVYLDTGHPGWHGPDSITPRLLKGGIAKATGFFTNVSNYNTDPANSWYGKLVSACIAYAGEGGDTRQCPHQSWPRAQADEWIAANVRTPSSGWKHFVTDSSRNGQGPWVPPPGKYTDPQDWCNPPNRGLGARPTLRTGDPLQDARLWIKIPGESDGLCLRGTPGPEDPERGMVDPKAGDWFREQALELVRLANPPILPGS
ncbi:glycoside hydrolase family 6 protein [Streptomyces sp. YC504]|uniref:Glucanase n=1 Tax=Streptomyces mesophilus TaxID=1775132 RepID=A0A6G4XSJ6_9ACTN|nr:glycoside hydrolase family 6 protein [Streptomyces mesophilus]NGO80569.1 glycoside hydrolase family 6 protein [Streptomyces mesophilus]